MDLLDYLRAHGLTLFLRAAVGVVVVWGVVTVVRWRRAGPRAALSRSVPEAIVGLGFAGVWAFTVAPLATFLPGDIPQHMPINLIPVLPLLAGFTGAEGVRENLPNLAANLVLYAPIGFGLRWRFRLRVWAIVLTAAAVSTAVEVSQALSDQMRSPDINDVILNSLGAFAGASAFIAVSRTLGQRTRPGPAAAEANPASSLR